MFIFDKQVDFFKKKINLPSETYRDLSNDEHDWAFIVAGATNMNIVADFREAVSKAIIDGTTIEEFRKDFRKIVKKHGWTYNGTEGWRTRIIYDTNLTSSYQAGRYEQLQEVKEYMPYWEYVHTQSEHERKAHKELDGTVLPADHEFWKSHYPPNGFNCKCTVHAHNEHTLKKQGKTLLKDKKVEVNKEGVPLSVHPSFNHTPSKNIKELESRSKITRTEIVADLLFKRAQNLEANFAIKALDKIFSFKPAVNLLNKKSNNFINTVLDTKKSTGKILTIGYFKKEIADNLTLINKTPNNIVISLKDDLILHANRNKKVNPIAKEDWQDLPSKLRNPERVLFSPKDKETAKDALIYVLPTKDLHKKIVISLDYEIKLKNEAKDKGKPKKIKYINPIITGAYIDSESELNNILGDGYLDILYDKKEIAED